MGVKSGSHVVMLSLFWEKLHVRIACNVNELEPQVVVFTCGTSREFPLVLFIIKMSGFINEKNFKSPW